jgi:hypothetical protein
MFFDPPDGEYTWNSKPPKIQEPQVQIETRKVYDVLVVGMSGRLDTTTSGDASDRMVAIAQGEDKHVVLNLEKLEYATGARLRRLGTVNRPYDLPVSPPPIRPLSRATCAGLNF